MSTKRHMSCSEACGIAVLAVITNLALFSDVAVHFIVHSKSEQKATFSLVKQLVKINLEVLNVTKTVSCCFQKLAQDRKLKNLFLYITFLYCHNFPDKTLMLQHL